MELINLYVNINLIVFFPTSFIVNQQQERRRQEHFFLDAYLYLREAESKQERAACAEWTHKPQKFEKKRQQQQHK